MPGMREELKKCDSGTWEVEKEQEVTKINKYDHYGKL